MEISLPRSLEEALAEIAAHPESEVMAGGTDLMVGINFGRVRPPRLMSLRGLRELARIDLGDEMFVGAGSTFTDIAARVDEPALALAAASVGSAQIRNAGTVGGNVGTCSPAGDALPALLALDAEVVIRSRAAERVLALEDFMIGPKRSALKPGELILGVRWRRAGRSQTFMKVGTRNAMVIAVASLCLVLDRAQRRVGLGLGSVAPTVVRAPAAEHLLKSALDQQDWSSRPLAESVSEEFGELVAKAAAPIDDVRGTAVYRRHVLRVMARRSLERACASL